MTSRELDLVIFGATGFTGALVAAYVAQHAPEGFTWGLAGRSHDKLARVAGALRAQVPRLGELPLLVADSGDDASLRAMAERTRVLCTTVGPYLTYGLPLVHAAAKAGTDVCDLTGEVPFIRRSIDAFDDIARASGARIVHSCGYDSIPSDLGTLLVQDEMTRHGGPAHTVRTYVGPSRGGISGGTAHSMLGILEAVTDPDVRRATAHAYALDPKDSPRGPSRRDQAAPRFEPALGQWTAPFFMAPINTRVVRRSHALLGHPWGRDFTYDEAMATGPGWRGRATATAITAAMGAVLAIGSSRPGRRFLERAVLPAPGDGPDADAREAGFFRHLVLATSDDPTHRRVARVCGTADPGYGETAKMLGESALALALDRALQPDRAGVLTPATALGLPLLDRLRATGMTWSVEAWPDRPPRP